MQTPAAESVPPHAASDAADACFLASAYGLTPDPWQAHVLEGWLGHDGSGKLTAPRCGLAVPRQNGKNAVIEVVELFKMVAQHRRVLHTAHEVKTARKAFARLKFFFGNRVGDPEARYPELNALVREVRHTNGQEAIVLRGGGQVEFAARSRGSGRGFSVDDLVMDEAQELSDDAHAALMFTLSASENPQRIYTGTPPGPSAVGETFSRIRKAGLSGEDPRLCWHEWSAAADADLDDRGAWAAANPALGIRLQPETVADERADSSDETFGRERLGLWGGPSSARVIDARSWALCGDTSSLPADRLALAVDVDPDRSWASVSMAGVRADGRWHVELDEQRAGTGWVVAWVEQRVQRNELRAVVVDGASPAATLIPELEAAGVRVTATGPRDMAQACGWFYDGVVTGAARRKQELDGAKTFGTDLGGALVHTDQPQMNAALDAARRRDLSGAWAWNRKSAASDITPLVAGTLALWGARASDVKRPKRRGRLGGGGRTASIW